MGTLSTVVDGKPWVVPMLYARVGDQIILHGSAGAGALRHVAAGAAAALSVTFIDGWVYAHTFFDSSANYRSAVVHGLLVELTGEEAADALTSLSESMLPGRSAELPTHTRKQLAATQALALDITDGHWTVKVRNQEPKEPDPKEGADPNLWTGTLPIKTVYGAPYSSAYLSPDIPVSASLLRHVEKANH